MIRYATAFVACLDRAWAPVISRAGFDFVPPGAVHSSPTGSKTACGVMEEGTFGVYCDDDRGIYFNWPEYVVKESYRQEAGRASVQYLIAHEYGHHVQWLTGISDDYAVRYGVVPEAARQTEVNRSEMQAHCFAAAFFGANRASLRIRGERLDHYGHGGYDRSDPELSNFDRWLRQAFRAAGPGGCRTWAAPAKSVTGA
nr:neutral zinc metallopeptidase [Kribbella solani]